MPSPATPEPRENPLHHLEGLVDLLAGSLAQLALGVAIGLLSARLLRARHLHWSWSAALLVVMIGSTSTSGCPGVFNQRTNCEKSATPGSLIGFPSLVLI